jgi:subtilisin family serine protease
MTGADRLHSLGIKGKGVKVGVIDSGIDYSHPSLGGGIGSGFKVAGGYDFVGDDFYGQNAAVPDDDPIVSCISGGHGTHVAGIIGAQDPKNVGFGLIGVAPEATIYAYRIFGCWGATTWELVIAAMERALADEVDIINMSLGAIEFFELTKPIFVKLEALGVAIIASAGNDGEYGPYHPGYPATDKSAIGVGSVNNLYLPTLYYARDPQNETVEYARTIPIPPEEEKLHLFLADNLDGESCDPALWDAAKEAFPDASKVVAVVSPGSFCNVVASSMVSDYGFGYYISVAGNVDEMDLAPQGAYPATQIDVPRSSWLQIKQGIEEYGLDYYLTVADPSVHDAKQLEGGMMSYFSSYGPTVEMSMRPQISAPGGKILSTHPSSDGIGYSIMSGTSMAAPHAAGCFALLKSVFPSLKGSDILKLLQSTSSPLEKYGLSGALTTTAQQGSGMINVYNAYKSYTETQFSQTELNVGDGEAPAPRSITITNKSKKSKKYEVSHNGALLVKATPKVDGDYYVPDIFSWEENNAEEYATASLSSSSFTLGAGASTSLTVALQAPEADPKYLPIYGGFIGISDGILDYSLPYLGIPYNRTTVNTIDYSDSMKKSLNLVKPDPKPPIPPQPVVFAGNSFERNNNLSSFSFFSNLSDPNFPVIAFTYRQTSSYIRMDLVSPTEKIKADRYGFSRCSKPSTNPPKHAPLDDFLGLPTYGEIVSLVGGDHSPPSSAFQKNIDELSAPYGTLWTYWYDAEVSVPNGTVYDVPNADYRVLIRALKPGASWKDEGSYESWLGPVLRIENF